MPSSFEECYINNTTDEKRILFQYKQKILMFNTKPKNLLLLKNKYYQVDRIEKPLKKQNNTA